MTLSRLEQIAASCPDPENRRFLVDALRKINAGLPPNQALDLCGAGAKRQRDRLLRMAAALMTGTTTERARAIERIDQRLAWRSPTSEAEKLIAQANLCCPLPKWRQLFTLIAIPEAEIATDEEETTG